MVKALRKMSTEELGRLYLFLTYLIKQTKYRYIARDKGGSLLVFSHYPFKDAKYKEWIVPCKFHYHDYIPSYVEESMFRHIPVEWDDSIPTLIEQMIGDIEQLNEEWDGAIIKGSIPTEVKAWGYRYD